MQMLEVVIPAQAGNRNTQLDSRLCGNGSKSKFISILWMFLLACAVQPASAQPYYEADFISPALLTPPPMPQDKRWKDEIEGIIQLQKTASEDEVQKALHERDMSPELVTQVESNLTREAFPAIYALLDKVADTTHAISDKAKKYWHTTRPYMADKRIKILVKPHTNNAYPSGHTMGAYTWAHVMGQVIPERRAEFIARAKEIAEHRVLVGMHFPHDLDGGRELALLAMGGLAVNKEFQDDLAKAKEEWQSSKKTP